MSSNSDKDKLAESYSYTTAAINQILVKANCPDSHRQFIYCLVGMAGKNLQLQVSDTKIAEYARGRIDGGNVHADKGWARDRRRALVDWQDKGNLEIIKCEVQDFDPKTKIRPSTIYTLNIVSYAEQVIAEAQKDKFLWSNNPSRAVQQAADKIVIDLLSKRVNTPKDVYIDPPSEVVSYLRTARTNFKKASEMLRKYDFQLMREEEKLLEEIENCIKEIRDRGFVDDILDAKIFVGIKKPKP